MTVFSDDSPALVEEVIELRKRHPNNVHILLGNHDHGHIGGPHTAKFFADEVVTLERRMDPRQIERMHHLFDGAMYALAAPCGLLFCHGSPDDQLSSLEELSSIDARDEPQMGRRAILREHAVGNRLPAG